MKKKPNWKKSGRVLCCTVTAAMLMFGLAACGDAEEKVPETTQESIQESTQESIPESTQEPIPESTQESTAEQTGEATQEKIFGQVTAIEGNTITLAVAEQPQEPEDTDAPKGGEPQLTLTGEVKIIIVDDGTLFTINGEEGALSDLAVNDTVTVTMEGDKVISVESVTEMPADKQ